MKKILKYSIMENCKYCLHFSLDNENVDIEDAFVPGNCQLFNLPTYGNSVTCSYFEHKDKPIKDERQLELFQ